MKAGPQNTAATLDRNIHCAGVASVRRSLAAAFTLIELLVAIAIIAILAGMLLPALSRSKAKGQSTRCVGQLRQLQVCWHMYVDDHNGTMPMNRYSGFGLDATSTSGWVHGNAQNDQNTTNIQNGLLFPYNRSTGIYYCPADRSEVRGHPQLLRTRSYSMDMVLNGAAPDDSGSFSGFTKQSQLIRPAPAGVFVFADEHENSINEGNFGVLRRGFEVWVDTPANRHGQAANFSYADGHVALRKWRCPKFCAPGEYLYAPRDGPNGRDAKDLHELQECIPQ